MTGVTILLSATAILGLSGIVLALFAVWQSRAIAGKLQAMLELTREDAGGRVQVLRERIDTLAAQIDELERQPSLTLTPGVAKPGMNVMKRAQALRLHRRGERPEKIAAALELPRQEVDLLLKVHRIVMSNI